MSRWWVSGVFCDTSVIFKNVCSRRRDTIPASCQTGHDTRVMSTTQKDTLKMRADAASKGDKETPFTTNELCSMAACLFAFCAMVAGGGTVVFFDDSYFTSDFKLQDKPPPHLTNALLPAVALCGHEENLECPPCSKSTYLVKHSC